MTTRVHVLNPLTARPVWRVQIDTDDPGDDTTDLSVNGYGALEGLLKRYPDAECALTPQMQRELKLADLARQK